MSNGACPSCGSDLPGAFPFCPFCGAALVDADAAGREERKVITVLFCDLVGSTAQAEQLDPEDVRALLSRYHARVKSELERFGGTVEKFIGDAVVALFGAPITHEDDPERAVRAALALRDWVADEPDLHVRIAVNTGEALIALGARPSEGDAMASGDVVNTAARMQAAAPVDGILAGAQTYRATQRVIDYRPLDAVAAKGKSDPVEVWEVVDARSRLGVDAGHVSSLPLVGRAHELGLLSGAFERVAAERTPQLLTLVGVPGIGKSRLVAELFDQIERRDDLVTWRQGRSLPYGEGASYWALAEIVKAHAGVFDTDSVDVTMHKIREMLAGLFIENGDAHWVARHLRPLVGFWSDDGSAADRRGEAFAAWRRFVEALAEDRPLVVVFEDLHWADDGLLDFVDHLADRLAGVPVLMVGTARPELYSRRPAWGGGKPNAVTLSLAPLSDAETTELVGVLLESASMPDDARQTLLDRAGGNPLYAQEFVRMASEQTLAGELPETVQGIIAARLDALPPEDKTLLQEAAVIGPVFWAGAVASVGGADRFEVEERLHALERRELVRRSRRSSVAAETEYAFSHALVREVAYGSIPRKDRAELHRRAAEWFESLERADDQVEVVAHHYLAALELSRAANVDVGDMARSAMDALVRAGGRAFALNAPAAAAKLYEQALELGLEENPRVLFQLGRALQLLGEPRAASISERARDAYIAARKPDRAAEACMVLAQAWWEQGRTDAYRAALAEAELLTQARRDTASSARTLALLSRRARLGGEPDRAIALGSEALDLAERLHRRDLVAHALTSIGAARASRGDFDEGIAELKRSVEIGLEERLPLTTIAVDNLAQATLEAGGDRLQVESLHAEGRRTAEESGNLVFARFQEAQLLSSAYDLGRWDEALERANLFIAGCEHTPNYMEMQVQYVRALLLLARGEDRAAGRGVTRALELAAAADVHALAPTAAAAARIHCELGNQAEAASAAVQIGALLARGVSPFASRAAVGLVAGPLDLRDELRDFWAAASPSNARTIELAILDGDLARAADMLADIRDYAREASVRMFGARALAAAGHTAGAREQAQRALDFFEPAGASRYISDCESWLGEIEVPTAQEPDHA